MPSGSSSPTSYPTKEPRITQALLIPPVMTVAFISNGSEAMMHLRSHLNWVLWGFPFSGSCPEHTGFFLSHLRFRHITAQRLKKKTKNKKLPRRFHFTAKFGIICFYFTKTIITCWSSPHSFVTQILIEPFLNFYWNFYARYWGYPYVTCLIFFAPKDILGWIKKKLFFTVDHFKSLYWICYNIASVLCFGFLATRHVRSQLADQGLNPHPCIGRGNPRPLDCQGSLKTFVLNRKFI